MQYTIIHTPPQPKSVGNHFLAISKAFPRLRPWASLGVPGRPYVPASLRKVRAEEGRRDMTPPPLNKVEFRDSVLDMDGRSPTPLGFAAVAQKNSLNHIFNCENGGYANYRHDNVRNAIAQYLRQICKDVTVEPHLIPISS